MREERKKKKEYIYIYITKKRKEVVTLIVYLYNFNVASVYHFLAIDTEMLRIFWCLGGSKIVI